MKINDHNNEDNTYQCVIVYLNTNIFLFLLSIFLDLIFYFFWFSFYFSFIDNKEAYDCGHMIYHMMWGHRPRLGKGKLEEWCQGVC